MGAGAFYVTKRCSFIAYDQCDEMRISREEYIELLLMRMNSL